MKEKCEECGKEIGSDDWYAKVYTGGEWEYYCLECFYKLYEPVESYGKQ